VGGGSAALSHKEEAGRREEGGGPRHVGRLQADVAGPGEKENGPGRKSIVPFSYLFKKKSKELN
jgi:hypothetical protein